MPKGKPARRTKEQNAQYYRNRVTKAQKQGYTGYYEKRKVNEYTADLVNRLMDRIDTSDYDWSNLDEDDPIYWIWFRVNYNKEGTPA